MLLASELSLDAVLQKIVDAACDIADARYGALGVLDRAGTGLIDFITHGVTDDERRAIGDLPVGLGLLGALITDPHPLRLENLHDDPRSAGVPPNHPLMESFLGVPVSIRGKVFGNLYLTQKRGAPAFNDADEHAVVTLAGQAAVAIENARLYEAAQTEQRRLQAISEVDAAVLQGAATDEIAAVVAETARGLLACTGALVALGARDVFVVRAGPEELVGRSIPPLETGVLEHAMVAQFEQDVSRPVVFSDVNAGPGVVALLQGAERSIGTMMVWRADGERPLSDDLLELLTTFAAHASLAFEFAEARSELARLALIDERERIAREIHDGVVQGLFSVGLSLQAAAAMVAEDVVRDRIVSAVDGIDEAIKSLRGYIFASMPSDDRADGLVERLRDLSVAYDHEGAPSVAVYVDEQIASVAGSRAPDVLQIVREALANAVRHAGAATVAVAVRIAGDSITIQIEDDGVGFDATVGHLGHGLSNIRTRAAELGGEVSITSTASEGTAVRVDIPTEGDR